MEELGVISRTLAKELLECSKMLTTELKERLGLAAVLDAELSKVYLNWGEQRVFILGKLGCLNAIGSFQAERGHCSHARNWNVRFMDREIPPAMLLTARMNLWVLLLEGFVSRVIASILLPLMERRVKRVQDRAE